MTALLRRLTGEMQPVPRFSLNGERYDQSEYLGRVQSFVDQMDPRTLLTSDQELEEAKQLLASYEDGSLPSNTSDAELWEAKKLVTAIVHPQLQTEIHPCLRMSFFVPANVPIVAGMLMTSSVGGQLFWQWCNQSYSMALNYANRSGSDVSTELLMKNYAMAVTGAMGLTASLKYAAKVGPPVVQRLGAKPWAVPYLAVALSGSANIFFTRMSEMDQGVPVSLEDGTVVGTSRAAARTAVLQTIASRGMGIPLPVLVLPPLLVSGLSRLPGLRHPRLRVPLELAAVTASLAGALPLAIAAFPQRIEMDASSLEPQFYDLRDKAGARVTKLYCNKGL